MGVSLFDFWVCICRPGLLFHFEFHFSPRRLVIQVLMASAAAPRCVRNATRRSDGGFWLLHAHAGERENARRSPRRCLSMHKLPVSGRGRVLILQEEALVAVCACPIHFYLLLLLDGKKKSKSGEFLFISIN